MTRPDRDLARAAFAAGAGWGEAACNFLAGDASARRYYRLSRDTGTAVLMDAPPGQGEDTEPFVAIAGHLAQLGLSAPAILAQDPEAGFLLLEDLGDDLFARLLIGEPGLETRLYAAAADVLVHLQRHPAPAHLPGLSAAEWAEAAGWALDWYGYAVTGRRADPTPFRQVMTRLLETHAAAPVMILRDYHAENLLWLPGRDGLARVGLLDFQLAQLGHPVYDLVSLLQDARRDVSAATEAATRARFAAALGGGQDFDAAYATWGAQRALRILGVFARLSLHHGKADYVAKIPRVWGHLQRNLEHPSLGALAEVLAPALPPLEPAHLERITRLCGTVPTP